MHLRHGSPALALTMATLAFAVAFAGWSLLSPLASRIQGQLALSEIQTSLLDLGPATRERDAAQLRADDLRRVLGVAQRDLGEKRGKLATVENAAVELFSQQQRRKELAARKALYDELTLSFGKKGVQALLIDSRDGQAQ